MMKDTARELREVVEKATPRLERISPEKASAPRAPGKWSRKEILGHLIDSASTNHQRFVRACYGAAAAFPGYAQDDWVRIQGYASEPWPMVVALWSAYNSHLSHVMARLPESAREAVVNFNEDNPAALEHVVSDYLRHLLHHMDQILDGQE